MSALASVVFVLVSLPAFGIGRYVRNGQRIDLIGGSRHEGVADPAGLARFFGNTMYAIGTTCIATGVALAYAPRENQKAIGIAFVIVTNVLVVLLIAGIVRHKRQRRER